MLQNCIGWDKGVNWLQRLRCNELHRNAELGCCSCLGYFMFSKWQNETSRKTWIIVAGSVGGSIKQDQKATSVVQLVPYWRIGSCSTMCSISVLILKRKLKCKWGLNEFFRDLRNNSAVTSTYCSCRGLEFGTRSVQHLTVTSNSSIGRSDTIFWPLWAPALEYRNTQTHHTQMDRWMDTQSHTHKKINLKDWKDN